MAVNTTWNMKPTESKVKPQLQFWLEDNKETESRVVCQFENKPAEIDSLLKDMKVEVLTSIGEVFVLFASREQIEQLAKSNLVTSINLPVTYHHRYIKPVV
jgi:hypothetical protein